MKTTIRQISAIFTALLAVSLSFNAAAASKQEMRMADAIEVINDFNAIPENAIPDALFDNAHAIAVFPGVIKIGFGIGAKFGKGVLIVRQDDGSWSSPGFVSIGGGSFGWQIGAQSTDLVLVFKDRRNLQNIYNGKVTLGGDASAAAGPVGRQTSAALDGRLNGAIFSYARNRGLFAGVSLEGAWMRMDGRSNDNYYGTSMTPQEILGAKNMVMPETANRFVQMMTRNAPSTDKPATYRTAAATPAQRSSTPADAGVRVYAIEPIETLPAETGRDETTF